MHFRAYQFLILCFALFIFLLSPGFINIIHAQVTSCWVTQFGNPTDTSQLPSGCTLQLTSSSGEVVGPCGSVVNQDAIIMGPNYLKQGSDGAFDYLSQAYSNCGYTAQNTPWDQNASGAPYWCTFSIVDAYNLAGIKGLSRGSHSFVVGMHKFWMNSTSRYVYVDYNGGGVHSRAKLNEAAFGQIQPGFAMFLESSRLISNGHEHVALIRQITWPNGREEGLDSRGNGVIKTYESNGNTKTATYVVHNFQIYTGYYPVQGFGGYK